MPNQVSNSRIQSVVFEMHGQQAEGPDILVDAAGTLQNIQVAGSTAEIWQKNSGWFTCAGDNGTLVKEGDLPSDAFFRLDAWRSLFFMCWIRYPSAGKNFSLWSYGNPNDGSSGGIGFSVTTSDRVRLRYNNGIDNTSAGRLTDIAIQDGAQHLVGGYFFQYDGSMFMQTFVDAQEQAMHSLPLGTWTTQPDTGFALFARASDTGLPVSEMYADVQVNNLVFFSSANDLRLFAQARLRQTYDLGRVPLPSQGPRG